MINNLKTALASAGCTFILYENEQIANVQLDQTKPDEVIGVIMEPNTITFNTSGNGVSVQYPPIYVEILKQVKPEDTAENNKATLDSLTAIAGKFVFALIRSGFYQKIENPTGTKVNERKYDANVIGWSIGLNLQPLDNKLNC